MHYLHQVTLNSESEQRIKNYSDNSESHDNESDYYNSQEVVEANDNVSKSCLKKPHQIYSSGQLNKQSIQVSIPEEKMHDANSEIKFQDFLPNEESGFESTALKKKISKKMSMRSKLGSWSGEPVKKWVPIWIHIL